MALQINYKGQPLLRINFDPNADRKQVGRESLTEFIKNEFKYSQLNETGKFIWNAKANIKRLANAIDDFLK